MRRSLAAVVTGLVLVMAVVSITAAAGGGRPLSTPMSGAEEVPGPGDANATGQADLTLNQGLNEVCFDLSWANIDGTVVAAHVQPGTPRRGRARRRAPIQRRVQRYGLGERLRAGCRPGADQGDPP